MHRKKTFVAQDSRPFNQPIIQYRKTIVQYSEFFLVFRSPEFRMVQKRTLPPQKEVNTMKKILTLLLLGSFFGLSVGCKKDKKDDSSALGLLLLSASNAVTIRTATEIASESNDDYSRNTFGLIEGSTLASWVSNWSTNKPTGITGKLVILQTDAANRRSGDTNAGFIQENPSAGVYVYLLDDYQPTATATAAGTTTTANFRFNQVRNTGLINSTVRYQGSGALVDEWLRAFGINPTTDLIVFAVGTANGITSAGARPTSLTPTGASSPGGIAASEGGAVQDAARGIYWLKYWGVQNRNLALLNGNIRRNFAPSNASLLSTTRSALPNSNGGFSVKQIRIDQTILTQGLEDVYKIVQASSRATDIAGLTTTQLIVDARPSAQFNRTAVGATGVAGEFITTAWDSAGPPTAIASDSKNYIPFEGNIKGAKAFPWLALFEGVPASGAVTDAVLTDLENNGYKYKSKSALRQLYADAGYTTGATVVSQCRTNFEAQVNGFAAISILGYPTTYYDGSLTEWTALIAGHPVTSLNTVPADFRWRTDLSTISDFVYNNSSANNSRLKAATVNVNATTTKQFIIEDKAYKFQ